MLRRICEFFFGVSDEERQLIEKIKRNANLVHQFTDEDHAWAKCIVEQDQKRARYQRTINQIDRWYDDNDNRSSGSFDGDSSCDGD